MGDYIKYIELGLGPNSQSGDEHSKKDQEALII